MRAWAALCIVAGAGPAWAGAPALVRTPAAAPRTASEYRLKPVVPPDGPALRLDDPRSPLATGYGGSMVNLFPFAGGKFHLSAGPRLFGRPGRPHLADPEPLRYLPAYRAGGLRPSRRMSPAMLIGYGKPVESGLSLGIEAGFVKGKITPTPDRVGRLNRARVATELGRGRPAEGVNELMRVTALYRF